MIVLRFFENQSAREIADALAIDPGTAQKRVTRAVERLRKIFLDRGVTHPASLLTETVSAHAVQAAPAALVKTVTAVALAKGAAAGGSTLTLGERSIKNYGLDESEDGDCGRSGRVTRHGNNHPDGERNPAA